MYRHRCVEAWSIVVPWVGFPLRKLLSLVQPLPGARYIRFETDKGPYMPNARGASLSPGTPNWPYVEGLAIQVGRQRGRAAEKAAPGRGRGRGELAAPGRGAAR